jgi:hypothetical protein
MILAGSGNVSRHACNDGRSYHGGDNEVLKVYQWLVLIPSDPDRYCRKKLLEMLFRRAGFVVAGGRRVSFDAPVIVEK